MAILSRSLCMGYLRSSFLKYLSGFDRGNSSILKVTA